MCVWIWCFSLTSQSFASSFKPNFNHKFHEIYVNIHCVCAQTHTCGLITVKWTLEKAIRVKLHKSHFVFSLKFSQYY